MLDDNELLRQVAWPERGSCTAEHIREMLRSTGRYVDLEGTIAAAPDLRPVATVRGSPLSAFLAEVPYVCQTWNPMGAVAFFERNPDLMRPVLVIAVPVFVDISSAGPGFGKDFTIFGITNAEIVDDLPAECIRAPGCTLLRP